MKKLLTIILSLTVLLSFSQQVARDKVVQEIGTGTWCPYCPGAAMGADDLIAAGCDVAVIEYHDGDAFSTTSGDARINYYNISGFPTAFFDGVLSYVGGSSTQSMYSNYLPLYQQRIAVPSDFTMEIYGENTSGNNYSVSIMVENENGNTNPDLVVHLALTESEIAYAWQGQSELNFVQRLMAPDHLGTTLNFGGGTSQQIDLTFTMDPSWNTAHCELVAFIQDTQTKEIQQGIKVDVDNLQPFTATAQFTCSDPEPCLISPVDFTDNSLGPVTNWWWTFEGGDPATSTIQNPTVTWADTGTYNVQLVVYDGAVYDTLLMEDYIHAITTPEQPGEPAGAEDLCEGETGVEYTTNGAPYATTYTWEVLPSSAGTISGPGTTGTLDLNSSFLGSLTVKVRAENDCGNSIWSDDLSVEVHNVPVQFTLSDGGGYCEDEQGIEVILDGSEPGIDYELYIDGDPTGQILPGTGSPLNFGYQTGEGIYSCLGYTDYCSQYMVGNTYIYVIYAPGQAGIPVGLETVCNQAGTTEYVTSGATEATAYSWVLEPKEAGEIDGIDESATVTWDPDYNGMAYITVQGVNNCGDGAFSEELEVNVVEEPHPDVTGDDLVCDNTGGHIYSTAETAGNIYIWEVTGGNITSGGNTNEIQVEWGEPGTGIVRVSEETQEGCFELSEDLTVTIDDCTGLPEVADDGLKVYPNPASGKLYVELENGSTGKLTVNVVSRFGKVVLSSSFENNNYGDRLMLNIDNLKPGIYVVSVVTEDGDCFEKKFSKF